MDGRWMDRWTDRWMDVSMKAAVPSPLFFILYNHQDVDLVLSRPSLTFR